MSDDFDLKIEARFLPDHEGEMRTVFLGAGNPGVLIEPRDNEDGSVTLEVTTGGCTAEELATLLYAIAVTLDPTLEANDD